MKKKRILMITLLVSVMALSACGWIDDAVEDAKWTKENHAGGDYYNEDVADAFIDKFSKDDENQGINTNDEYVYEVGETVDFTNGISVTITDWGKEYSLWRSQNILYFEVEFENNGSSACDLTGSIFSVYADDYAADFTLTEDDALGLVTIDVGRKAKGKVYAVVNPENADKIEVQLSDTVWVLKDKSKSGNLISEEIEYSGKWHDTYSGCMDMTIEKLRENTYSIYVYWSPNVKMGGAEWTMTAYLDTESGKMTYSDGIEMSYTYNGAEEESEIVYMGGTGKIWYQEGYLVWSDDNTDMSKDALFVKSN